MQNEECRTKTEISLHSAFCILTSALPTMPTASRDIIVTNKLGLHARPAMQFVDLANQFKSDIKVVKFGEEPGEADGKSVMQMIILAATEGTKMRIDAEGDDAEDAMKKLAELFESKFGEED